ncbi:MAG TPA: ATP-binding cassette domain-containing protein, partial [Acidimicrobiales bacterium]|nr:ATP-binding cassette domain-containing protein [Acidimicrobiales bacterium]
AVDPGRIFGFLGPNGAGKTTTMRIVLGIDRPTRGQCAGAAGRLTTRHGCASATCPGERVALDGLSFAVDPGRIFGFLGPNGAGKTTTMRIVLGIDRPDQGAVRWGGRPVDDASRLRFGYMPEQRGLYPRMALRDQLVYLARLHRLEPDEAEASVDWWLQRLGVAERATDRLDQLSHGNQQRVQLAAALVHNPDLLVLDEPFSGLDPVGVQAMVGVLRERVEQGATVVFSSHQLDLVEDICDEVVVINRGEVALAGEVRALKAAGAKTLVVQVAGASDDWLAGTRASGVTSDGPGRFRMELDGIDP